MNPVTILGLTDRLFAPIHYAIERVLPKHAEDVLRDPQKRTGLVDNVDTVLCTEYPAARAVPTTLRRAVIARALALAIDVVLLGPTDNLAPTG